MEKIEAQNVKLKQRNRKLKYQLEKLKEIEEEHKRINGELREENKQLKDKIKELIKYGYGTDMSIGEFKGFYKLATGKDYDPKECPEVE